MLRRLRRLGGPSPGDATIRDVPSEDDPFLHCLVRCVGWGVLGGTGIIAVGLLAPQMLQALLPEFWYSF